MFEEILAHVRRLGGWWLAALLTLVIVAVVANQQLAVLVYKVLQVCVGVVMAYVADRALFQRTVAVTPSMPQDVFGAARLLARALVALGVITGVTIGI